MITIIFSAFSEAIKIIKIFLDSSNLLFVFFAMIVKIKKILIIKIKNYNLNVDNCHVDELVVGRCSLSQPQDC